MDCISNETFSPTRPSPPGFIPKSEAEWAAVNMKVMKRAMVHGNVAAIQRVLADRHALEQIEAHWRDEGAALIAEARHWLKDALAHEDAHGPGSRLDLNNPWVRDVLIPGKQWLMERPSRP